MFAPSLNVTVPELGVVGPVTCETVAVSVVDWPNTVGLTELVRVVVVFSTTVRVPGPEAVVLVEQLLPIPPVPVALAVKDVWPGETAVVVETVRVEFRVSVELLVS